MSAHRTSAPSQSLTVELSSPPTYCTGLRTRGSSGSSRAYTDSTGTVSSQPRSAPLFGRDPAYKRAQAGGEEVTLAGVLCEQQRLLVGLPGFAGAAQAAQKVGARGGQVAVARQ